MLKMLDKIYEGYANSVRKGANVAVGSYNWVTGGTKADLANEMLTIAPILEVPGFLNSPVPLWVIGLTAPLFILISHSNMNKNKKMEEKETRAINNSALDLEAEKFKRTDCLIDPAAYYFPNTLIWAISNHNNGRILKDTTETDYIFAAGMTLRGLSCYAMTADNFPRQKNCLKRGADKLSELVSEYMPRPGLSGVGA